MALNLGQLMTELCEMEPREVVVKILRRDDGNSLLDYRIVQVQRVKNFGSGTVEICIEERHIDEANRITA